MASPAKVWRTGKGIMRDVIRKIIATEADAKQRVQAARSEAERILAAAQKRAQELTAVAQREVQTEARNLLAAAWTDAEKEKQARLAQVAAVIEKQVRLDETARQQTVVAVVRCVRG